MKSKTPLTFFDYVRIFSLTYSVLKIADAHLDKACLAYSLFAAKILRDHFDLNATVTAGAAAYLVNVSSSGV